MNLRILHFVSEDEDGEYIVLLNVDPLREELHDIRATAYARRGYELISDSVVTHSTGDDVDSLPLGDALVRE